MFLNWSGLRLAEAMVESEHQQAVKLEAALPENRATVQAGREELAMLIDMMLSDPTDNDLAGWGYAFLKSKQGDQSALHRLMKQEVSFDVKGLNEIPLIQLAIYTQNLSALEALLTKSVDIESTDKFGNTALIVAAEEKQKHYVERLIQSGANLNAKNKTGATALHRSLVLRDRELADYLYSAGARIERWDCAETHFESVFHTASTPMASYLFKTYPEWVEKRKSQLLNISISRGDADLLALWDHSAMKVWEASGSAGTHLHFALDRTNKVSFDWLIKEGVINAIPKMEWAELIKKAAAWADAPEVLQEFLNQGISIESKDLYGETAFLKAVSGLQCEAAERLIASGANPQVQSVVGNNAASIVDGELMAEMGCDAHESLSNMVQLLIKNGVNLLHRNEKGRTLVDTVKDEGFSELAEWIKAVDQSEKEKSVMDKSIQPASHQVRTIKAL